MQILLQLCARAIRVKFLIENTSPNANIHHVTSSWELYALSYLFFFVYIAECLRWTRQWSLTTKRLKVDHEGKLSRINEDTRKDVLPKEIDVGSMAQCTCLSAGYAKYNNINYVVIFKIDILFKWDKYI